MQDIGAKYRKCRKEKGITATYIANKINKNLAWVTQRELGDREITVPDLILLAGALEVDPAIFFSKNFGETEVKGGE